MDRGAHRYAGIPGERFAYRLGNRFALEWVIDQYQLSTEKRFGITIPIEKTNRTPS
ncbi:MAG TPA: hypothetical protein VGI85_01350 [Chthoniobacterales bacterium]